jgi:hypothetical protein
VSQLANYRFLVGFAGGALLCVVGLTTSHYRYQEDDERDQRCRAEGHYHKSLFTARLKVGVVHYSQRDIAHPVRSAVLSHSPYLGGCSPGDVSHSVMCDVISFCRAFLSRLSR